MVSPVYRYTAGGLRVPSEESLFIADILGTRLDRTNLDDLKGGIAQYEADHRGSFSLPLHLHLLFLRDFLDAHPQRFHELMSVQPSS